MELHQIRYFLALCEELNFTRAAERCSVAQSSLTRAIKALEIELGAPLFHRERANTHLSKLGQTVKPFLEQAYSHVEGARRQALDFVRLQATSLRLGLMCTIAPHHLLGLIEAMRARHPEVALHVADATAGELQQRLIAGDLDVAIYALPTLVADERFNFLPLYREPFVIALRSSHRLARQDSIRVKDLAGEARGRRIGCEYEAAANDILARQGADGAIAYQSERDDWVLAMAAAGLGYALMPETSAKYPGVVSRPLIEPEISREIALVTLRGRAESPGMGALVREVMRTRWAGAPGQPLLAEGDRVAATR
jgi:DNA-binding transcriptional LysR family regulator